MVKIRPLKTVLTTAVARTTSDKPQKRKMPSGEIQTNTTLPVMAFLMCQIDCTTTRMAGSMAAMLKHTHFLLVFESNTNLDAAVSRLCRRNQSSNPLALNRRYYPGGPDLISKSPLKEGLGIPPSHTPTSLLCNFYFLYRIFLS